MTATSTLAALVQAASTTARLLAEADEPQWAASPIPRPREDTTERSKGAPPSDPTADTALDARRLRLRLAVIEAERALASAVTATEAANRDLTRALDEWSGHDDAEEAPPAG